MLWVVVRMRNTELGGHSKLVMPMSSFARDHVHALRGRPPGAGSLMQVPGVQAFEFNRHKIQYNPLAHVRLLVCFTQKELMENSSGI